MRRGGGRKVRYVPRNQGNQTFWAGYPGILLGYPGILLGYPGVARKIRKIERVQFVAPTKQKQTTIIISIGPRTSAVDSNNTTTMIALSKPKKWVSDGLSSSFLDLFRQFRLSFLPPPSILVYALIELVGSMILVLLLLCRSFFSRISLLFFLLKPSLLLIVCLHCLPCLHPFSHHSCQAWPSRFPFLAVARNCNDFSSAFTRVASMHRALYHFAGSEV